MRLQDSVGYKVINKVGQVGTILSVDDYILVEYDEKTIKYKLSAFEEGYIKLEDLELHEELMATLAAEKLIKEEEKRRFKEEQERLKQLELERLEAEKKEAKKAKKKPKLHPYIDQRRKSGKSAFFLVCQNKNYELESSNGFIYAPKDSTLSYHVELELVEPGDIILHHFNNTIYALSVVKNKFVIKEPCVGHECEGIEGRYVDLAYHFLENPTGTKVFKEEKKKYGSMKYGPFEKTSKNKQGFYLSEVSDELAKIFIDAAIADNPTDVDLKIFRAKI